MKQNKLKIIQEIDLQDSNYCRIYENYDGKVYVKQDQTIGTFSIQNFWRNFLLVLKTTFLPSNYPHSVKKEYLEYQVWDAIQGLCSYLRSVITTRSVLAGVGVGNAAITPLAAALAWVIKDGFGMVGSLTLAYYCADSFETYTKEWRLMADLLNNVGLTCDLLCSAFPEFYQILIITSSVSKSCCGLIAGSTKARISAHFANQGHLADVTAKESTQETAIALIGLVLGMILAKYAGNDEYSTWIWFLLFLVIHVFCNYRLMKVLVFTSLNPQRVFLIAQENMKDGNKKIQLTPNDMTRLETLWLPCYLWLFGPKVGVSLDDLLCTADGTVLATTRKIWQNQSFMINISNQGQVKIALEKNCTDQSMLKAYFISCYLSNKHRENSNRAVNLLDFLQEHGKKALDWFDQSISPMIFVSTSPWNYQDASALGVGRKRYEFTQGKTD